VKKNILEDEKIKNNRLSKHLVKGYSAPKKTLQMMLMMNTIVQMMNGKLLI